ncbi:MAG TPA: GNAT family N-acetyltransferase [Phycisphaerales bacterium]|nr:GNAT family N-acetyltransferase [Phycisphaerales bacterium]
MNPPSSDTYTISTNPASLDLEVIHSFLATAYWSPDIPRHVIQRAIANSLCFGVYDSAFAQVGFARVITDYATFAYLCDVFILPPHRGKGLSKKLMQAIIDHPQLQHLRRFMLFTRDAHALYAQFDFKPLANPDSAMSRHTPNIYMNQT